MIQLIDNKFIKRLLLSYCSRGWPIAASP